MKKDYHMDMRRIFSLVVALGMALTLCAQARRDKFDPKKFRAELESFITKEACLTPTESAAFFPLYDEMNRKQRGVFDKMRRLGKSTPASEEECRRVLVERDKLDLELKKMQQTYHNKFLTVLSAKKVFAVLKAEDCFHRRMLRRDGNKGK